jgi:lanthanide-dependent methanol dehydrogenase
MYTCIPRSLASPAKFKKFDVLTGKTAWDIPDPYANWGGALVTDGGLVFYGSLNGDFRAVDRNSGKVPETRVWHWIGLPVAAGLDMNDKFGAIGATAMAKAAQLDKIPQGGTLYTFRLSSD